MRFSIIIPAHNEEAYIGKCLQSIRLASKRFPGEVETIVCINRCTDATEEIAKSLGCKIAYENARNIAKIRNAAATLAQGEILITIDADSWMAENMLSVVDKKMRSGRFIGGGVRIKPDRVSLGIIMSLLSLMPYLIRYRISAGLFWTSTSTFRHIGGFNENLVTAEDVDFGLRLKSYGSTQGKKYGTVWASYIVTSCRKFDIFGDWYFFLNPGLVRKVFEGKDSAIADKLFHDARNSQNKKAPKEFN